MELARSLLALGRLDAAGREARTALQSVAVPSRNEAALLTALGLHSTVLSTRQVEVLRLIADGLGDREIAGRLVISEHTVHRHVANIYTRLGCSTRAAAVSQAAQLGLM